MWVGVTQAASQRSFQRVPRPATSSFPHNRLTGRSRTGTDPSVCVSEQRRREAGETELALKDGEHTREKLLLVFRPQGFCGYQLPRHNVLEFS